MKDIISFAPDLRVSFQDILLIKLDVFRNLVSPHERRLEKFSPVSKMLHLRICTQNDFDVLRRLIQLHCIAVQKEVTLIMQSPPSFSGIILALQLILSGFLSQRNE